MAEYLASEVNDLLEKQKEIIHDDVNKLIKHLDDVSPFSRDAILNTIIKAQPPKLKE